MLKSALQFVATRLTRPVYGGIGSIFALHRVIPESRRSRLRANRALEITPQDLDAMLDLLRRRRYDFVPLDDVGPRLRAPRGKFAVFTLDDGYRDNVEFALPVFRQHNAPFTVNATRTFAERTDGVWWYALEQALHGRAELHVRHEGREEHLALPDDAARERAFGVMAAWIRGCQLDQQRALIAAIFAPLGLDPRNVSEELILNPTELKELARDPLVTLGAHTLHHLTSNILSEAALRVEFSASKRWLELLTGQEIRHLAYPFGGRNAVGAREFRMARECGFRTAVTTRFANLFPAHADSLFQLPRLEISGNYRVVPFTERAISGLLPALRNQWRRIVAE